MSFSLIGALSARLYQIGNGGRGPIADAAQIAKQFFANVQSCVAVPANLYSECARGACRREPATDLFRVGTACGCLVHGGLCAPLVRIASPQLLG